MADGASERGGRAYGAYEARTGPSTHGWADGRTSGRADGRTRWTGGRAGGPRFKRPHSMRLGSILGAQSTCLVRARVRRVPGSAVGSSTIPRETPVLSACRSTKTQVNLGSALNRSKYHQSNPSNVPGILDSNLSKRACVYTSKSLTT